MSDAKISLLHLQEVLQGFSRKEAIMLDEFGVTAEKLDMVRARAQAAWDMSDTLSNLFGDGMSVFCDIHDIGYTLRVSRAMGNL